MNKKNQSHQVIEYMFDAKGQSLGRFASLVAVHLRGKMLTNFKFHVTPNVRILIKHIDQLDISEKKLSTHTVNTFSGYPGGLKQPLWQIKFAQNPQKFFMRVVEHMMPKNRLSHSITKQVKFL